MTTEKERAKAAAVEFREFCTFTEGLLAKGTPYQIALSHNVVSNSCFEIPSCSHSKTLLGDKS